MHSELLTSLVRRAQRSIVLVDGYVDAATLNVLAKKAEGVVATVWTHPKTKLTQYDIDAFNAQYPQLTLRHTTAFHDRLLVLDDHAGLFRGRVAQGRRQEMLRDLAHRGRFHHGRYPREAKELKGSGYPSTNLKFDSIGTLSSSRGRAPKVPEDLHLRKCSR